MTAGAGGLDYSGKTEIKCAGTPVLAYAVVLHLPRWCRQNSHVTCSKIMAEHCLHCTEIFFLSFTIGSDNYSN